MTWALLTLLALPFAAALGSVMVGHRSDATARGFAVGGQALALVLAFGVALPRLGDAAPMTEVFVGSGAAGGPAIELAGHLDPLAAVMLLLVHTVAFLVQLYSLGYLADDPRYPSYAMFVSLFTGAMTTVVVADDLWMLLIGWELMGACSYFLIGHHWELSEARAGAVKAFLMTRTADLGLLFAIIVLGIRFDSYRISTILAAIGDDQLARDALWLPAVLITVAVIGKSAQFPLHTWLPDAMPGPTPISALIHAATMVAAGVYLVARMFPLYASSPAGLNLLGVVAAFTMLLAALYALFSDDLKRVLAWSTVSQLAYMFGALAVGATSAAILHLLAHGAFKALLFLSAGSVVHAVGTTSMSRMGALRDRLPDTFITMTLGFAALAGIVPLVGFFTKDAVVGAMLDGTDGRLVWPWIAWLLFLSGVVTAVVTVAYATRAWLLVFFGEPHEDAGTEPHESPWTMRVPLYLLSVPTVVGGLVVAAPERVFGEAEYHLVHPTLAIAMTSFAGAAALWTYRAWRAADRSDPWHPVVVPHPPVDRLYDVGVVRPVQRLAVAVKVGDRDVIEGYVDGAAAGARGLGWLLRLAQNGYVQGYLIAVVVGAAALAVVAGVIA